LTRFSEKPALVIPDSTPRLSVPGIDEYAHSASGGNFGNLKRTARLLYIHIGRIVDYELAKVQKISIITGYSLIYLVVKHQGANLNRFP